MSFDDDDIPVDTDDGEIATSNCSGDGTFLERAVLLSVSKCMWLVTSVNERTKSLPISTIPS